MRAILEAAGKRVHVYTSPHLVRFHERIRLGAKGGGRLVNDAELLAALEPLRDGQRGAPITFFEITTAAAFIIFSDNPADYLLLEVGLGGRGRRDQCHRRAAGDVITSISMDHTGISRQHHRQDRLREGRHLQAGRAGDPRPAAG